MDKKINYFDLFKVKKYSDGGNVVGQQAIPTEKLKNYRKADLERAGINSKNGTWERQPDGDPKAVIDSLKIGGDPTSTSVAGGLAAQALGLDMSQMKKIAEAGGGSVNTQIAVGAGAHALNMGMQALGGLTTGDKNFSPQSEQIDNAVNAATSKLMASGNPYLMAAGAIGTTVNELTKMGGQTTPGFEVEISSSGYGNLGKMEDSSSRGFFTGPTASDKRQLDKRNEQAAMSLAAANVADDTKFEQEARMNSVQNTIQNNAWALDGGVSTDLLAAKHGAKLVYVDDSKILAKSLVQDLILPIAKNGAKLKQIETSEEENVIPTGTLHKNKHNLDLEEITKKGIPVIQNINDSVETFEEIKEHEKDIVQSAEIESLEIIFNKELTDFIEERMKDISNKEVCKEVGMRLCKEILFNTKDKSDLIETLEQKELNNDKV